MRILLTGGLGFIGSSVVRRLISETDHVVLNIDKVTYAATHTSVQSVADSDRYQFAQIDIVDAEALTKAFSDFKPDAVMHLAAESHVDRSIDGPGEFIQSNIVGTFEMLQAARAYATEAGTMDTFRFLHISTDEVFGALQPDSKPFDESTPYDPRSPYSASKAASDHLVRAWHETFGLATLITNCSNNYGPFQFPEKLIPLMILKSAAGQSLPVYGKGENIRDWLFVDDHAAALISVLESGKPGETYAVGGNSERTNIDVVNQLCDLVDAKVADEGDRRALITYVTDRPGHDLRYAIDASKIKAELGWEPAHTFEEGLAATVGWYIDNEWWWRPLLSDRYEGERLGVDS